MEKAEKADDATEMRVKGLLGYWLLKVHLQNAKTLNIK